VINDQIIVEFLVINSKILDFLTGTKEVTEEKMKAPTQKAPILQKGRFSVTSDDNDLEVNVP
jgi:hypothetical protein